MLFNSLEFGLFLLIVFPLYLCAAHKLQNLILLAASYFFYGWWDWRFLSLLLLSTAVDFYCGRKLGSVTDPKKRKLFLWLSLGFNLGLLGFFKYFNFFAGSFQDLAASLGWQVDPITLNVILPVGISFYTFQTMSYVIDVYRGELKPAHNLIDFALFVAFFPQLVAGPIERATHLLPQMQHTRTLTREKFYEGCYLIFFGLFQKIFVADNLAAIVDRVFASPGPYSGFWVLLGVYAFAFQIYGDFAGYSNIARGLSKCMGFELMVNFNLPYFAVNPSDFWRRWHISLSTWLRDYLYIPLGGNRKGTFMTYRNLLLTMVIGGLWHGAAWKFVVWGALHGIWLSLHRLMKPWLDLMTFPKGSSAERVWFLIRLFVSFHLICLGWLFFRANSLSQALVMLQAVFANFALPADFMPWILNFIYFVMFLLAVQIYQFYKNDLLAVVKLRPVTKLILGLSAFYLFLYAEIFVNSVNLGGPREFIYFQF